MSFTRFAIRLFFITALVLFGCYLYTIYSAVCQKAVMTLATGKRYVVHPDLLVSSGLGKGDIGALAKAAHYSLVNPEHKKAYEASLSDTDLVVGIVMPDGTTCAYARSLLLWHQVINDRLSSHTLLVALCPFTDTITCFSSSFYEQAVYFGVSGMVYLGSLVMYDRDTQSLWSAVDGRALVGPMSGFKLDQLPCLLMSWGQWRSAHPETLLVTGSDDMSDYTVDPYCKLYMHAEHNLYGTLFCDDRLSPQTPVVGVVIDDKAVAYPVEKICALGCVHDVVQETPILVTTYGLLYEPKACPIAVFDRRVQGKALYFVDNKGRNEDTSTRSFWDVSGCAYEGPLKGTELKRLPVTCTTWFTWSLFYPNTRIY